MPDYTWFWWKLRPHPRLGTVEVRALDAQASLEDEAAIVALTHCLVRDAAEARSRRPTRGPELVEEGMFRAARFGTRRGCPMRRDGCGRSPELLDEALGDRPPPRDRARLRRSARAAPGILSPAAAPAASARHEIAGMDALLRELTGLTGG